MQVQRDPLFFYSEPSFAERAGKLYLSPSDRDYWRPSRADSRGRSRCRSCCYLCAGDPLRNLSSDHFKYLGRNSNNKKGNSFDYECIILRSSMTAILSYEATGC